MDKILEIKDLSKTYNLNKKQKQIMKTSENTHKAVDNLSLCVNRGEIFGLLGPNGAGKTTTLKIISTLLKQYEGEVRMNGIDIKSNPLYVKKRIGFLTSELKLEEYFTPHYIFNYFGKLYGISKNEIIQRREMLFSEFGIKKYEDVKIGNLSTGMKQKVSLVITLINDPELIIFDEPTNGLDIISAKVVTDFLIYLKSCGKTILLSTHIFSLVEDLCDRVGIIINGKLSCCNTVPEIMSTTNVEKFFFECYKSLGGDEI